MQTACEFDSTINHAFSSPCGLLYAFRVITAIVHFHQILAAQRSQWLLCGVPLCGNHSCSNTGPAAAPSRLHAAVAFLDPLRPAGRWSTARNAC